MHKIVIIGLLLIFSVCIFSQVIHHNPLKGYLLLKSEIKEIPNSIEIQLLDRLDTQYMHSLFYDALLIVYTDCDSIQVVLNNYYNAYKVKEFDSGFLVFIPGGTTFFRLSKNKYIPTCSYFAPGLKNGHVYSIEVEALDGKRPDSAIPSAAYAYPEANTDTTQQIVIQKNDDDYIEDFITLKQADKTCFNNLTIYTKRLSSEDRINVDTDFLIFASLNGCEFDKPITIDNVDYYSNPALPWGKYTIASKGDRFTKFFTETTVDKKYKDLITFTINTRINENREYLKYRSFNAKLIDDEGSYPVWIDENTLTQLKEGMIEFSFDSTGELRKGRTPKTNQYDTPPLITEFSHINQDVDEQDIDKVILLEIEILADGLIGEIIIKDTPDLKYNDATINCVRQWKFRPAKLNGDAVACWITVPLNIN
ncbi:MAG: energy transducer TonB [Candidatus Cloacimonetes bacterium]|nr:energy transducer TonB [Candidatus Cloacimonadota bacterium]